MSPSLRFSLLFLGIGVIALFFADFEVVSLEPLAQLKAFFYGFITPSFGNISSIAQALLKTVAFALLAIFFSSIFATVLAMYFQSVVVQKLCAFFRSVHELFWALIFLQIFGLSTLTGLLALVLPYTAILAKVYAESMEESKSALQEGLHAKASRVSLYAFVKYPLAFERIKSYTLYRLECALRSSAVLGFVGLPTLGFYLESSFKEGYYSEVGAMLLLFYLLIGSLRFWLQKLLVPFYILGSFIFLAEAKPIILENVIRFFSHDIIPSPLRRGEGMEGLFAWFSELWHEEIAIGLFNTIVLSQIVLVGTAFFTLLVFPFISKQFFGFKSRVLNHTLLVVLRSTPEYMLAFILLQVWGPSMLPAAVALSLHNGAIIGFLVGQFSDSLVLRQDSTNRKLERYFFEVLPRVYTQFLAYLFYRWEVIVRETAILGILGIETLGFFIDSSMQDLRFDKAIVLILITALLNMFIDDISRFVRRRLRTNEGLEAGCIKL